MTGDVKVSPPPHFVGALFLSLAIARLPLTPSRLSVDKSRQTLGRQPFPFTRPWRRLVAEDTRAGRNVVRKYLRRKMEESMTERSVLLYIQPG